MSEGAAPTPSFSEDESSTPSSPAKASESGSGENCPFKVCLTASCDGRSLIVSHICHTHNHGKFGSLNNPVTIVDEISEIYVDRNAETEAAKELIEFSHKAFRKRKNSENSSSPTKKVKEGINDVAAPLDDGISMSPVVVLKNVKDLVREKPIGQVVSESSCLTKAGNFAKQNVVDIVSRKLNISSELTVSSNICSKELFNTANSSLSLNLNKEVKIPKIHAKTVAQINLEPENVKSSDGNLEPDVSCKDVVFSEHNKNDANIIVSNNSFPNTSFSFEKKEPISYVSNLQNDSFKASQEVIIIEDTLPSKEKSPVIEVDPLEHTSEKEPDLNLKIENVFRTNEASFESNQFYEDANSFANSPHVNLLSMSDIYIGKGYPYDLFFFKCTSCKVSFNLEKDFVVHNRSPIHYKATMTERQSFIPDKLSHVKNFQKTVVNNVSKSTFKSPESSNSKGRDKSKFNKPFNKNKIKASLDQNAEVIKILNEVPMKNSLQPVPYFPLNLIKRRIVIIGELDNREEFLKQQKLKDKFSKMHNINNSNNDMPIMFVPYQVKVRSAETGEYKFIVMYLPHFDTESSSKIMKDCWSIPENSWIGEVEEPIKSEVKFQFNHTSGAAMDEIKVDKVVAPVSEAKIISPNKYNNVGSRPSKQVSVKSALDKAKFLSNPCFNSSNSNDIPNIGLKSTFSDVSEAQLEKKHKRVSWEDQCSKIVFQSTKLASQPLNTEASFMETLGLSSVQQLPPQTDNKDSDESVKTSSSGSVSKKLDLYIDSIISKNVLITGIGKAGKQPIPLSKEGNSTFMTKVPRENYLICQKYFPTGVKNIPILEQKTINSDSVNNISMSNDKTDHFLKDVQSSPSPLKILPNSNQVCRPSPSSNINKLISNPSPGTPNSIKIKPSEFRLLKVPILKLRRIKELTGNLDSHPNINSIVKDDNSFNEDCKLKEVCPVDVSDTLSPNLEKCDANEIPGKGVQLECSPAKNVVPTDLKTKFFNNKSLPFQKNSNIKLKGVSDHQGVKLSNCTSNIQICGIVKEVSLPITASADSRNAHSVQESKSCSKNIAVPDKIKSLSLVKHLEENSKFISALLDNVKRPNKVTEDEYDHMPIFQNVETSVTKTGKFLLLSPNHKVSNLNHNKVSVKKLGTNESKVIQCNSLSPSKTNKHKIALFNKVLNKMSDVQDDDSVIFSVTDKTSMCTNMSPSKSSNINIDIIEKVSSPLDNSQHNLVNSPSTDLEKNFMEIKSDADENLAIVKTVYSNKLNEDVIEEEFKNNSLSKTCEKVLENKLGDCVFSKTMQTSSIDKSLGAISDNSEKNFNLKITSNTKKVIEDKLLNEVDELEDLNVVDNSISYVSLLNDMDYNEPLPSKFEAAALELDQPDNSKKEVLNSKDPNFSLAAVSVSVSTVKKPTRHADLSPELTSEINKVQSDSSKKLGCESGSVVCLGIRHLRKIGDTSNHKVLPKEILDRNKEVHKSVRENSSGELSFSLDEKESTSALSSQPLLISTAANVTTLADSSQMKVAFSGTILKVRRNSLNHSIIKNSDVIRRSNSPSLNDGNFKDRIIKASKVIGLSSVSKSEKSKNEVLKKTEGVNGNVITIKTSLQGGIKKSFNKISLPFCNQLPTTSGGKKPEDNDKVIVVSGDSKRESLPTTALTPRVVEIAKNINSRIPASSVQVINENYDNGDFSCLNQVFPTSSSSKQLNILENSGPKYTLEKSNKMDEGSTEAKQSLVSTVDNSIKSKVSESSSASTPNSSPKVCNEESLNRFHYKDSDNDDQRDSKFEEEDFVDKLRENSTPGDNLSLVDENEWQDNLADFEAGGEDGYCRLLLQDM